MSGEVPSPSLIETDKRVCVGSGMCVAIAPGAFQLGVDLKVQVKDLLEDTDLDDLLEAEESCPVSAITIRNQSHEEN